MPPPTFSDIVQRNRVRMETLGIPVSDYTLEVSLLQVMSSVGELATLSCNSALGFSKFERDEVDTLIGRLTVSLATLSELFEVSAEEAALRYLDDEEKAASRFTPPSRAAKDAASGNAEAAPSQSESVQEVTAPAPLTVDGFFEKIDQLAFLPLEAYSAQDIRWVVPTESGDLKELISGGAQRRVTYDDFPLFLRLLQPYRDERQRATPEPARPSGAALDGVAQRPSQAGSSLSPASAKPVDSNSQEPEVLTKVVGYSADRDAQLFSPTHFTGGLFSPMASAADIRTATDVRPPSVPSTADYATAYIPPQAGAALHAHTAPRSAERGSGGSNRIMSPISQPLFFDYVEKLREGRLAPQQISRLHLTFAVPDKDNGLVPLLNGGESIAVTSANVGEFLRLVDRTPVTMATEPIPVDSAGGASSMLRRTSSLRKVEVQNRLANDRQDFSPSHFSYGLFAPSKPMSEVYVDYDEGEQMLPPFLRNAAAAKRREGQQSQQPQQPQQPAPNVQNHQQETNVCSAYVTACSRGNVSVVKTMIDALKKDPRVAEIYGITYCIPSCCEPNATKADCHDGLYALYPNSKHVPVDPDQANVFLTLVRQYFPDVA